MPVLAKQFISLLQIEWGDLRYSVDDLSRTVYSFPVHIRILLAITLIFILVILILLGVVLSSRIYKTSHAIRSDELKKKYEPVFRQLLFEERTNGDDIISFFEKSDLSDDFNRETILAEIIHLHENFTGEAAERLEEVFVQLKFHNDSIQRLSDKRWYVIAKGMRELALMNVRESLQAVSGYINNPNEILRMEARIAIMKLSENDPLSFLSIQHTPLSGWDTANIYSMLSKMPERMVPDFSKWLDSPNKDVVLFCIQMIGAFLQQQSIPKLIQLLRSPDDRIRLASVRALRSLSASAAEPALIEIYPKENIVARTEILKTLEVMGSNHSASFIESILHQPFEDYPLVIQAVRSLLALGASGNIIVEKLLSQSGQQMQLVINHAKDKRL